MAATTAAGKRSISSLIEELAALPDPEKRVATIKAVVAVISNVIEHPNVPRYRKVHVLALTSDKYAIGITILESFGFIADAQRQWWKLPASVSPLTFTEPMQELLRVVAQATAAPAAGTIESPLSGDAPVDVGPPSTWSFAIWHDLRLDQAFPMLGRGGAQKIKQHCGIENRVGPLMDLIEQSSLDAVFDKGVRPFIDLADKGYKASKSRGGFVRSQIEAAYAAYRVLSPKDKSKILDITEKKAEDKKAALSAGRCLWPIWSSPLCEIFRYLPPDSVQSMMHVCSHWRREAERNRIWRPLVCKYYPSEKLDVEDETTHSYRRWRMRWLAMKQYSRVAVKISFGPKFNLGPASMHQAGDPCLFDIGEEFGTPQAKEPHRLPNIITMGWDAPGAIGWGRDRAQQMNSISGRYTSHGPRPTESRITDTNIHFPLWDTSLSQPKVHWRNQALVTPNPTGWRAQVPPGTYRVWVLMGDAVYSSPVSCYVQSQQVFSAEQMSAPQIGFRSNAVIVNVGPSGVLRISPFAALVDDVPSSAARIQEDAEKKLKADMKRAPAAALPPNEWSCTACTFLNTDRSLARCAVCDTNNPRPYVPPPPTRGPPGMPLLNPAALSSLPNERKKEVQPRLVAVTIIDVRLFDRASNLRIGAGSKALSQATIGMDIKLAEHKAALLKAETLVVLEKKAWDDIQDEEKVAKAIRQENVDSWKKWQVARIKQIDDRWREQKEGHDIRIKEATEIKAKAKAAWKSLTKARAEEKKEQEDIIKAQDDLINRLQLQRHSLNEAHEGAINDIKAEAKTAEDRYNDAYAHVEVKYRLGQTRYNAVVQALAEEKAKADCIPFVGLTGPTRSRAASPDTACTVRVVDFATVNNSQCRCTGFKCTCRAAFNTARDGNRV